MKNLFRKTDFYVTNAKYDRKPYRCTSPGVLDQSKISTVVDNYQDRYDEMVLDQSKISTVVDYNCGGDYGLF